jgi:hypothetical protein
MKRYGYPLAEIRDYEKDHLVPIPSRRSAGPGQPVAAAALRRSIGSWVSEVRWRCSAQERDAQGYLHNWLLFDVSLIRARFASVSD